MLKACWDCVAGNGGLRSGGENEGSYGVQLNGNSERAPLRPARQTASNMLLIPKRLHVGDKITISSSAPIIESFQVNLFTGSQNPDYNNIACQLEVNMPTSTSSLDGFTIRTIENGQNEVINGGYQSDLASDVLSESTVKLEFSFELYDEPEVNVFVNGYLLEHFPLKHKISDITFLSLSEIFQVKELSFLFS